jgi:hypothetical protein
MKDEGGAPAMKKSRLIIVLAAVIVFAGMGTGILAYLSTSGTNAQAATLPDAALWMPSSANFVAYIDLETLLSSPLREDWEASHLRENALSEVDEFREKTGMNPWTDFRALALSSRQTEENAEWGLALTGELNPERIISSIEEKEELEQSVYRDTTLYSFKRPNDEPQTLAFPTTSIALFGSPAYVQEMLDVGAGDLTSVVEGPLAGWINELPLDDTFWCVGSSEFAFSRFMARRSEDSPQIPPVKSFAVSGSLSSEVSMIARGKASDPEAARKLADVVRGFIALGSLKQESPPEFQAILDSVQIEVLENKVLVSVAFPYETLRRLASHHREADK